MKYRIMVIFIVVTGFSFAFGQEQTMQKLQNDAQQFSDGMQLPPKNSTEYWNVRTEAISEFIPFLSKKRAHIRKTQKLLTSYLLQINKGADFTSKDIPLPKNADPYFELLQIGQGLEDMNISKPTRRPSWNELMDVVMKHVVYEGYMPTIVEEGEDLVQYIEVCKKKEQYGQKVRKDIRTVLEKCVKMWVYLESINKKDDFKIYYANLKMQQEAQRAQAKAQYKEQRRQFIRSERQQKEKQKYDDAMNRAHFEATKKQNAYDDRQNRLQYQQNLLNARFVGSGGYH